MIQSIETKVVSCWPPLFNCDSRRLAVTEGIIAQKEMGINCPTITEIDDSEEAKIRYMLETAEEPDILMADMSHEQLVALSKYNLKLEVCFKNFA